MQSFLDRRSILSLKKRQPTSGNGSSMQAGHIAAGSLAKSITMPNSPRSKNTVKQIKHSDKSNGSFGGAEITTIEEARVEVNVALLSEKLQAYQM